MEDWVPCGRALKLVYQAGTSSESSRPTDNPPTTHSSISQSPSACGNIVKCMPRDWLSFSRINVEQEVSVRVWMVADVLFYERLNLRNWILVDLIEFYCPPCADGSCET